MSKKEELIEEYVNEVKGATKAIGCMIVIPFVLLMVIALSAFVVAQFSSILGWVVAIVLSVLLLPIVMKSIEIGEWVDDDKEQK